MSAVAVLADLDRRARSDGRADRLFRGAMAAAGIFVLLSLAGAALSMLWGGREAFATFGWGFLTSTSWDPDDRTLRDTWTWVLQDSRLRAGCEPGARTAELEPHLEILAAAGTWRGLRTPFAARDRVHRRSRPCSAR